MGSDQWIMNLELNLKVLLQFDIFEYSGMVECIDKHDFFNNIKKEN